MRYLDYEIFFKSSSNHIKILLESEVKVELDLKNDAENIFNIKEYVEKKWNQNYL